MFSEYKSSLFPINNLAVISLEAKCISSEQESCVRQQQQQRQEGSSLYLGPPDSLPWASIRRWAVLSCSGASGIVRDQAPIPLPHHPSTWLPSLMSLYFQEDSWISRVSHHHLLLEGYMENLRILIKMSTSHLSQLFSSDVP